MTPDFVRHEAMFDGIEHVIADPLRFKLKLSIGEDAYTSLRTTKNLWRIWDVGSVAASGAALAKSSAVATTFFASTASSGFLSMIGLGAAAVTPLGWVAAAAVASGTAYYGVIRITQSMSASRVDAIPKFINTPIDVLAVSLFDLMCPLALRVADIDKQILDIERRTIADHFIDEWGYDRAYVAGAMAIMEETISSARVKELAQALAQFQANNPDCNPVAMQSSLIGLIRNVAAVDGALDEREELAIEAIERAFRDETELTLRSVGRSMAEYTGSAATAVKQAVSRMANRRSDSQAGR